MNTVEMCRSLLLLAFGLPVHHLPEARQDLALPLPPLLLVEGGQSSLFICTVDLVLLSQTHSLHTTMSAGSHLKFVSIAVMIRVAFLWGVNCDKGTFVGAIYWPHITQRDIIHCITLTSWPTVRVYSPTSKHHVPAAAHHVARLLKVCDLVAG